MDFLYFLEGAETAIEKEDARLRIVTQKRFAERLKGEGKEEEEKAEEAGEEDEDEENEEDEDRLKRMSQLTTDSLATAKEVRTIYEIPPLQTGLKRSLSCPPCPTRRHSDSV